MGEILKRGKGTIFMFTVFIVILLVQSYGLSVDSILDFTTELKEFNVSDLRDDVVSFIVDGTADVTIGIYDYIMEGIHSKDVDTGMSEIFGTTRSLTGYGSFESLVKGIASTLKSRI